MSKILILDHEVIYRNMCREMLLRDRHTVIPLASGDQLLLMLETQKPDLVLMDPCLPREDGFSLLKKISADFPVIAFTSRFSPEIEKQAFEAGAVEVLSKTADMDTLRRKVKQIFSRPKCSSEKLNHGTEKVLVVDDEAPIRLLLKTFLERKGFCTLTASSGEEALETVRREHPVMILLDVRMPGIDGLQTLKKIREIDPQAGVVMATGMRDENMIREATTLGASGYVFKPFDMQYLELVVLTRLIMSN